MKFIFIRIQGQFESIRFASERYYRDYQNVKKHRQKNYFRALQDIHMAFNLTVSLNGITVIVPIVSHPLLLIYVVDRIEYSVHYPIVVLDDNDLMLTIQLDSLYSNSCSIDYELEFDEYDIYHCKDSLIVQLIADYLDEYVSRKTEKYYRIRFVVNILIVLVFVQLMMIYD